MGAITSRRDAGVEVVDISSSNAYKYPPKTGNYFGSHFIMGGERFDTIQPEVFLFGENTDLNFLGNRPIPFPYPAPQPGEPTKTLKSLVNIRKDSLKLIRIPETSQEATEQDEASADKLREAREPTPESDLESANPKYNVEFTFDSDVKCAITIYYFATEEMSNGQIMYHPRDATMNSETFHYKRGANQVFSQSTHILEPAKFDDQEWQYSPDKESIPIVIQCLVEEGEHAGHAHMTFATIEKSSDGIYAVKPLKQKQMVDGLCYLLQEIYGIENKQARTKLESIDDEWDDNGSECVICMSDIRDTLILPCRHLCLCNNCADSLRYQANNCPICRSPFRALLQIRAMRKKVPNQPTESAEENPISQEGVPPGYEAVSLIETLNGPSNPTSPASPGQDGISPPASMVSSPPLSPSMNQTEKRKLNKRQPSVGSNSLHEEPVMEESETELREEKIEEEGDGRTTPEVVMSGPCPEPIKHKEETQKKGSLHRQRRDKNKRPAISPVQPPGTPDPPLGQQDSVEIVNEIKSTSQEEVAKTMMLGLDSESSDHALEGSTTDTSSTPVTQISNIGSPHEDQRPAHSNILYDQDEEDIPTGEEEALVAHPELLDMSVSLPGTPSNGTDESSYGSTSSAKMLISMDKEKKHGAEKSEGV